MTCRIWDPCGETLRPSKRRYGSYGLPFFEPCFKRLMWSPNNTLPANSPKIGPSWLYNVLLDADDWHRWHAENIWNTLYHFWPCLQCPPAVHQPQLFKHCIEKDTCHPTLESHTTFRARKNQILFNLFNHTGYQNTSNIKSYCYVESLWASENSLKMGVPPQMAILIGKHDENQFFFASNLYQAAAGPSLRDQCPGGEGIPWWLSQPQPTTIVIYSWQSWHQMEKKPWETLQHLQGIWLALREVVSAWFLFSYIPVIDPSPMKWNTKSGPTSRGTDMLFCQWFSLCHGCEVATTQRA